MYRESIASETLTLQGTDYEGEYIAKWRGLTVCTASMVKDGLYAGQYAITDWGVDQESTSSPDYAQTLDRVWDHAKAYCKGEFRDEWRESQKQSRGRRR